MIFSQNNEQQIILDYFGHRDYGTFLDVGANDGKTLSNTHGLALLGWDGICVEPAPEPFDRLKDLYEDSKVVCYQYAIGDHNGKMDFHISGSHLGNGDTGLLSTLSKSERSKWKKESFEVDQVNVLDWKTFYEGIGSPQIDFMSIDAEGYDWSILRQMNLKEIGTSLICVEFNQNRDFKKWCDQNLKGFRLVAQNYENLIYGL